MDITLPNISALNTGVNTRFNLYLGAARGFYDQVAITTDSTGAAEEYPRLDQLPGIRKWVGDRLAHDISATSYRLVNDTYEETVSIARKDVEDDKFGMLNLAVQKLGQDAGEFPDRLVWGVADVGQSTLGPDGQYFFDTDHLGWDAAGAAASISNYQSGSSPAWYLMDLSKVVKPFIYQKRRPFQLTSLVNLTDANVFYHQKFIWGTDGRCAAGYGMWQLAYKSKAALTVANFAAARLAMMSLRRPDGQPLAITPTHLVIGPALKGDANRIAVNDMVPNTAGTATESNPWKGTVQVLEVPYIS